MSEGLLLVNLGSPASINTVDVRAYLNEFLMDPYVLDTPWLLRRLIVSCFILPFRPKNTARAYASIWTDDGSPLISNSRATAERVQAETALPTRSAMRYGQPDVATALRALQDAGVSQVRVVPMYPHYADSTHTTCIEYVKKQCPADIDLSFAPPFFNRPDYISNLAASVRDHADENDYLLMSYHGLPERHMTKADPTGNHCLAAPDCCTRQSIAHDTCYRHQIYATSTLLADALGRQPDRYTVAFQSRLGRLPWLTPYTDVVLEELPAQGHKRLAVICPAFVADNLETLEEMGIRGRATFLGAGGESFTLVPCLNVRDDWVNTLAAIATTEST